MRRPKGSQNAMAAGDLETLIRQAVLTEASWGSLSRVGK